MSILPKAIQNIAILRKHGYRATRHEDYFDVEGHTFPLWLLCQDFGVLLATVRKAVD